MEPTNVNELQDQHFEHKIWMNELNFYADEIVVYEHQLEVLVGKGIKEMLPELEKFQNNFIRQKEVIDKLKHDINSHEHELALTVGAGKSIPENGRFLHQDFHDEMDTFKRLYTDLKMEFLLFWKKWH